MINIHLLAASRYKRDRWMQFLLFAGAIVCGIRLIWMVNRANWKVNKKQVCNHMSNPSMDRFYQVVSVHPLQQLGCTLLFSLISPQQFSV
jgi:hypothetical protein